MIPNFEVDVIGISLGKRVRQGACTIIVLEKTNCPTSKSFSPRQQPFGAAHRHFLIFGAWLSGEIVIGRQMERCGRSDVLELAAKPPGHFCRKANRSSRSRTRPEDAACLRDQMTSYWASSRRANAEPMRPLLPVMMMQSRFIDLLRRD